MGAALFCPKRQCSGGQRSIGALVSWDGQFGDRCVHYKYRYTPKLQYMYEYCTCTLHTIHINFHKTRLFLLLA